MPIRLEAFGKVNLSLRVLGRRADGFHELDTLFQTVDLSDELTFEESDRLELVCPDDSAGPVEDNLVVRAARALAEASGRPAHARISLTKRIPVGGGMAGGSSDAAAALLGLSALWNLPVDPVGLAPVAGRLGSDVPFFLFGGTARGTGRGDVITPLSDALPRLLLLVFPPWPVSTPAVFRLLSAPPVAELTVSETARNLRGPGPESFPDVNDLEGAAERLRGELAVLRKALGEFGATQARLSGSGSTLFGVFPDHASAQSAGGEIERRFAGVRTALAPTLGRDAFARRAVPVTAGNRNR